MRLKIKSNHEISYEFFVYLIDRLRTDISDNIQDENYSKFEESLSSILKDTGFSITKIEIPKVLRLGLESLKYIKIDSFNCEIFVDNEVLVEGTRIPIISIIKFVEYGNLRLKPILLFREIFKLYSENIQEVYEDYLELTGIGV